MKPENIMLSETGKDQIRLVDFGLSRKVRLRLALLKGHLDGKTEFADVAERTDVRHDGNARVCAARGKQDWMSQIQA